MEVRNYKCGNQGIGIAKVFYFNNQKNHPVPTPATDAIAEVAEFKHALQTACRELSELSSQAEKFEGTGSSMIFQAHIGILKDVTFTERVCEYIMTKSVNASYATWEIANRICEEFNELSDALVAERVDDIYDVSERLIRILTHQKKQELVFNEPIILVAESLTPSELFLFDPKYTVGIVTKSGGFTSHVALMSAGRNIPYLFGASVEKEWDSLYAIIDGDNGKMIVDPEKSELIFYNKEYKKFQCDSQALKELVGLSNQTKSGKIIELLANVGHPDEVKNVVDNDGHGIGLFRSEYIFLSENRIPSEEEQTEIYSRLSLSMPVSKVVIRTADLGSDKKLPYLYNKQEGNPAMGCRGIRFLFQHPEILFTQLRAIYKANSLGNLWIMYPMIISLDEVHRIKAVNEKVMKSLKDEGISFCIPKQGIMIETPAAALISDKLANEVDFFSIGTNDLTQYTLAIDRQNPYVSEYYSPYHDGIFKLIEYVVKNAHAAGITVDVCGELASNPKVTQRFIEMGVDELSVSPINILPLRRHIRKLS